MILRYLAAYGPASVADAQTWSGLTRLSEVFDRLDLRTYTDATTNRTLYDLPHLPLPHKDTEAPTRFLPEYDNLLLSHADRTRFLDTPTRQRLTLQEVLTRGSVLHDGHPKALWKLTKTPKTQPVLEITPFTPLTPQAWTSIETEAQSLLTFTTPTTTPQIKRLTPKHNSPTTRVELSCPALTNAEPATAEQTSQPRAAKAPERTPQSQQPRSEQPERPAEADQSDSPSTRSTQPSWHSNAQLFFSKAVRVRRVLVATMDSTPGYR